MAFYRIILMLFLLLPGMVYISGCSDDNFLDTMKEEEDFIAPFDVVLSDDDESIRTTYFDIPELDTAANYSVNPESVTGVTTHGSAADGEDNVVHDKTTGLMWTRCSTYELDPDNNPDSGDESFEMDKTAGCTETPTAMEWIYAAEFCKKTMNGIDSSGNDTLPHYAGYNDWRLPRISELISIVNFNETDPAINNSIFPNTVNVTNSGYWSFTSKLFIGDYFETIDHAWIVFLKSSLAQFPSVTNIADYRRKLKTDLTSEKQYVKCVRGGIVDPF